MIKDSRQGASDCFVVVETENPATTRSVGACFAQILMKNDVVALDGDLGAGKTCFVGGVAKALGISGRVTSPTFTLVTEHPIPRSLDTDGEVLLAGESRRDRDQPNALYHFDAYRLPCSKAFSDIGLMEYFTAGGVCFIEWAERIRALLPSRTLFIRLERLVNNSILEDEPCLVDGSIVLPSDDQRRRLTFAGKATRINAFKAALERHNIGVVQDGCS